MKATDSPVLNLPLPCPARKPFGQERWTKHQNSWRHLRHILDLGTSRIQLAIAGPLAWIVAVAVAACSFYTFAPVRPTIDDALARTAGCTAWPVLVLMYTRS